MTDTALGKNGRIGKRPADEQVIPKGAENHLALGDIFFQRFVKDIALRKITNGQRRFDNDQVVFGHHTLGKAFKLKGVFKHAVERRSCRFALCGRKAVRPDNRFLG